MGDWAESIRKVVPGRKVYLFTGPGNAVDVLVGRACAGVDHQVTLRPPFGLDDLGVLLGTPDETQVIVVRDFDTAGRGEVVAVATYLSTTKRRGQSLVLVGDPPDIDGVAPLRPRISAQGVLVDARDPKGAVGRKDLTAWVADEWCTTIAAATRACERAGWAIEPLLWATRVFRALTSGHPVEGIAALRLVDLAVQVTPGERAYHLLLTHDPAALDAVAGLTARERLTLFRRLESALTDLELIQPVLGAGHKPSTIADRTGLHVVRVLELLDCAPRYPPGVVLRCRQIVALALANHRQPESGKVAAMLWR